MPTPAPSAGPTAAPSAATPSAPTRAPTKVPTTKPTRLPSKAPTARPSTAKPSVKPSATPTAIPTSPARVCLQWALGQPGETCSATCSGLQRVCKDKYFETIVTQDAFYALVDSSINARNGAPLGSAASYCSLGTNVAPFPIPGAPAALQVVLSGTNNAPVRTLCTYPTSAASQTATCDSTFSTAPPYRRFCPCVDHICDVPWYLGASDTSCTDTCHEVGGVCDLAPLEHINTAPAFDAMLTSAVDIHTNATLNATSAAFCNQGINTFPFATAPAVISFYAGGANSNQTFCTYPTTEGSFQGACDTAFPAVRRFCNCKVPPITMGAALV